MSNLADNILFGGQWVKFFKRFETFSLWSRSRQNIVHVQWRGHVFTTLVMVLLFIPQRLLWH